MNFDIIIINVILLYLKDKKILIGIVQLYLIFYLMHTNKKLKNNKIIIF